MSPLLYSSPRTKLSKRSSIANKKTNKNKNSINSSLQSANYNYFGSSSAKSKLSYKKSNYSKKVSFSFGSVFKILGLVHSPLLVILIGYSLFNVFASGVVNSIPARQSKAAEVPQIRINYNQSIIKSSSSK
jgi:hypothetical protein